MRAIEIIVVAVVDLTNLVVRQDLIVRRDLINLEPWALFISQGVFCCCSSSYKLVVLLFVVLFLVLCCVGKISRGGVMVSAGNRLPHLRFSLNREPYSTLDGQPQKKLIIIAHTVLRHTERNKQNNG